MQNLIPLPASLTPGTGKYTLHSNTVITVPARREEIRHIGQFLAEYLRPATGYELPVLPSDSSSAGSIVLTIDETSTDLGQEGYELTIDAEGILLRAPQPAGLFHGIQTIRQLLRPDIEARTRQSGPWQMDCATIRDFPRYSWRGAMMDVARHFFPVADIKRLIDLLAYYKFNILHLHLTDDQGWRLMINSWSRLAEHGGSTDATGGPGGYFTQEDYRQIVAYADARFITIIPEVDMPAHVNSALASYPELNDSGVARPLQTNYFDLASALAIHKDITYRFLEDVLREVAALTPGAYLHIGGDEALSTNEADYQSFIVRAQKIVQGIGKQCIGWEEMAKAELLPDTIIQYWWQTPLVHQAARNGHKLIVSPASRIYLDIKYNTSTTLGLDWTKKYIEVQDAYDWDPLQVLEGVTEGSILGVEAPLWSETIITRDDMDHMFFPRLPGVAEIGWTPRNLRNWEDYRLRLATHGTRLTEMGVKFYRSPQVDWD